MPRLLKVAKKCLFWPDFISFQLEEWMPKKWMMTKKLDNGFLRLKENTLKFFSLCESREPLSHVRFRESHKRVIWDQYCKTNFAVMLVPLNYIKILMHAFRHKMSLQICIIKMRMT